MPDTTQVEVEVADVTKCFLFPTHDFWKQFSHPVCPACMCELFPSDYMAWVTLADETWYMLHADCWDKEQVSAEPEHVV